MSEKEPRILKDPRDLGVPKQIVNESARTLRHARESLSKFLGDLGEIVSEDTPDYHDRQYVAVAHHRRRTDLRRIQAWAAMNATFVLGNADDHVQAMERVLLGGEPVNVWPCISLSRVVMEACVRVCRMYDADCGVEGRLVRAAAAQLESAHQHLVAAREFRPELTLAEAERQWERSLRTVEGAGLAIGRDSKNRPVNVSLGGATENISGSFIDMARGRLTHIPSWYRISSGASHNMLWMVQQAGALDGLGNPYTRADPHIITASTLAVLGAFEDVTSTFGTYHGNETAQAVRAVQRRTFLTIERSRRWQARMERDAEMLSSVNRS